LGRQLKRIPRKHGHICVGFFLNPLPPSVPTSVFSFFPILILEESVCNPLQQCQASLFPSLFLVLYRHVLLFAVLFCPSTLTGICVSYRHQALVHPTSSTSLHMMSTPKCATSALSGNIPATATPADSISTPQPFASVAITSPNTLPGSDSVLAAGEIAAVGNRSSCRRPGCVSLRQSQLVLLQCPPASLLPKVRQLPPTTLFQRPTVSLAASQSLNARPSQS